MEHNGIRQAKSVIVNRNAYSPGRTIICISYTVYDQVVSGHLRSDLNKLRNYLLLDLALRDPTFAFHEEWFEYHDTIFPFLKLYLQLRSIEGICLNRSLNKFSYRFSQVSTVRTRGRRPLLSITYLMSRQQYDPLAVHLPIGQHRVQMYFSSD